MRSRATSVRSRKPERAGGEAARRGGAVGEESKIEPFVRGFPEKNAYLRITIKSYLHEIRTHTSEIERRIAAGNATLRTFARGAPVLCPSRSRRRQRRAQIGIVIGGGNIFRGLTGAKRVSTAWKGDQMGMLATIINSLALQSALEDNGVKCKVLTSIRMGAHRGSTSPKARALRIPEAGYVVIGGGTSNPLLHDRLGIDAARHRDRGRGAAQGTRVDGGLRPIRRRIPAAVKFDRSPSTRCWRAG